MPYVHVQVAILNLLVLLDKTIDNEYYVTGMGNTFTVVIEMYSTMSSNLKPCVLNVNEFF